MALISGQQLQDYPDSFVWNLDAEGVFSVGTTRKFIDDNNMIHALTATRWSKFVPRRANILIWRLRLDRLPLRFSFIP